MLGRLLWTKRRNKMSEKRDDTHHQRSFADAGGIGVVSGDGEQTGTWYAIWFASDTVFATLTSSVTFSDVTNWTFPKGSVFRAAITVFELTSGNAVAYETPVSKIP